MKRIALRIFGSLALVVAAWQAISLAISLVNTPSDLAFVAGLFVFVGTLLAFPTILTRIWRNKTCCNDSQCSSSP